MVRLRNFQIKNYRSCLDSKLELTKNVMCLIGVNGVGKTNILNSLQLLKKIKGNPRFPQSNPLSSSGTKSTINATFSIDDKQVKVRCEIVYETDDRNTDEVL